MCYTNAKCHYYKGAEKLHSSFLCLPNDQSNDGSLDSDLHYNTGGRQGILSKNSTTVLASVASVTVGPTQGIYGSDPVHLLRGSTSACTTNPYCMTLWHSYAFDSGHANY
jgi:hypothetical protein